MRLKSDALVYDLPFPRDPLSSAIFDDRRVATALCKTFTVHVYMQLLRMDWRYS